MGKRYFWKRILSATLATVILALFSSPVYSMAFGTAETAVMAVSPTVQDELAAVYGEDAAQELLRQMASLGLVDEAGNVIRYNAVMDGREYSLDELQQLLAVPGVDLAREVTIDGQALTLGDVKTMLDIEDQLGGISEIFGEAAGQAAAMTQEHELTLASLLQQMENEGISIAAASGDAIGDQYASQNIRVSVTSPADSAAVNGGQSVTYTLTLSETPLRPVTLDYTTLDGAANSEKHYTAASGTITFPAGATGAALTQTVTVQTKAVTLDTNDYTNTRWQGERAFAVQFTNIRNALFDNESTSLVKTVRINGNHTYNTSALSRGHGIHYFEHTINPANTIGNSWTMDGSGIWFLTGFLEAVFAYDFTYSNQNSPSTPFLLPTVKEMLEEGIVDQLEIGSYQMGGDARSITASIEKHSDNTQLASRSFSRGGTPAQWIYGTFDLNIPEHADLKSHLLDNDRFVVRLTNNTPGAAWDYMLFFKTLTPELPSLTAPAGTYTAGQTIPITAVFSKPVRSRTLETHNGTLSPVESSATYSRSFTYLYTVKETDNAVLQVKTPSATDLGGNVLAAGGSLNPVEGVELAIPAKRSAFSAVTTGKTAYPADAAEGDIIVSVKQDTAHATWILNDLDADNHLKSIVASIDGGQTFIPLEIHENDTTYVYSLKGIFELEPAAAYRDMRVELYQVHDDDDYELLIGSGLYADFSVAGVILLEDDDFEIVYPDPWLSGEDFVIYDDADEYTQLAYEVIDKPTATFQEDEHFIWSVENVDPGHPAIAIIGADGTIRPTGEAYGKIKATLTATNGGLLEVPLVSNEIEIKAGNNPFLKVKTTFVVTRGNDLNILWDSNVIYKNTVEKDPPETTTFTVYLYEGNYTDFSQLPAHKEQWTATNTNSLTMPAEALERISVGGNPSYTFKVEVAHPNGNETMEALGYILVNEPAVQLQLSVENRYLLDTAAGLPISWTMQYFDTANESEFEFVLYKGSEPFAGSQIIFDKDNGFSNSAAGAYGGSYSFTPDSVDSATLYDLYTVELRAKNATDSTWSYDSTVLYVYNTAALDILVDGAKTNSLLMSNVDAVKDATSAEILELYYGDKLNLRNVLSINYKEYEWNILNDMIEWNSSDTNVASVNYKQGSLYENIEKFSYSSYAPGTEFILSGLTNGETEITATHARTGMQRGVDVTVEKLDGLLYIFQVYPLAETTITYQTLTGEKREAKTDSNGALALYEEDGISGNVKFKSEYNGTVYLGTVRSSHLSSGERDSTNLEQYPLNHVRMREIAKTTLYFKLPDGTPYTGAISFNGGVYKNGSFCQDSQLAAQGDFIEKTLGTDGKLELDWDATLFWSEEAGEGPDAELLAGDTIEYIFEVHTENDYYFPQIVISNTSSSYEERVTKAEHVVFLERTLRDERKTPFITHNTVELRLYNGVVLNYKTQNVFGEMIGANDLIPEMVLKNTVLWWGTDSSQSLDGYTSSIRDLDGVVPGAQSYKTYLYPFSTIPITENYLILNEDTLWMDRLVDDGMFAMLSLTIDAPQTVAYKTFSLPFIIVNAFGLESFEESDDLESMADELIAMFQSSPQGDNLPNSDSFIVKGLNFLSNLGIDSKAFTFNISPTADPLVYNCKIEINIGKIPPSDTEGEKGWEIKFNEQESEYIPGPKTIDQLYQGTYADKYFDELEEQKAKGGDKDILYQVGGYYNSEIRYNAKREAWECVVLNGGFTVGGGGGYHWNFNSFVGPVPVTATLGLGAAVVVNFNANVLYADRLSPEITDTWRDDSVKSVNDYLTKFRVYAYFNAFGGIGFDYSVLALKIGLFGEIRFDFENAWLNRTHLLDANERVRYGNHLDISGTVGIKFVAKFLFFSYEKTLASAKYSNGWAFLNWDMINEYWKQTTGRDINGNTVEAALEAYQLASGNGTEVVSSTVTLEGRDYLDQFDRQWISQASLIMPMSLDDPNRAPQELQTNAYTSANPELFSDGEAFVYLSDQGQADVNMTRAAFALKEGSGFVDHGVIDDAGYGDTSLQVDGTAAFAAATWVRQTSRINKEPGEAVSDEDIAQMTSSTEIMVSVFEGATWTTQALTDNLLPDLAPVVATNGNRVLVAWRSVYASDPAQPTDFDASDKILYSVYADGIWSAPETLYNGSTGSVMGLSAAMLDDGTAAVAYAIDKSGTGDQSQYEMAYAVVDTDPASQPSEQEVLNGANRVLKNLQVTDDEALDENPQLITVADSNGDEYFVLGWYSQHSASNIYEATGDIRLCAFDNTGTLYAGFPESISAISSAQNETVGADFRFVHNTLGKSLGSLSIVWSTTIDSERTDGEVNLGSRKSVLKAIKLLEQDGRIYTSAVLDVAEMDNGTIIDHFTACLSSSAGSTVQAVILASKDTGLFDEVPWEGGGGEVETLRIPITESGLYTATETYINQIVVDNLYTDLSMLYRNGPQPVSFTLFNGGYEPIEKIEIEFEGQQPAVYEDISLLPGANGIFTPVYNVPDTVVNPEYTITAYFTSGTFNVVHDSIYLTIQDIGITAPKMMRESDGEREFNLTLYNNMDVPLEGSGRVVKLGIYDNDQRSNELLPVITVEDDDALHMIDEGAYSLQLTFNIKEYIEETLEMEEIPESGVTIYAIAWIEEDNQQLLEPVSSDNVQMLTCSNLQEANGGQQHTVSLEQTNTNVTSVEATVQNLAMQPSKNGNVLLTLFDEKGNILESTTLTAMDQLLLQLGSEQIETRIVSFTQLGAYVQAVYFEDDPSAENHELQRVSIEGAAYGGIEKEVREYSLTATNLDRTVITALAVNGLDTVEIQQNGEVLASGTGQATANALLVKGGQAGEAGENIIKISVLPHNGPGKIEYTFTVANMRKDSTGGVVLHASALPENGWINGSVEDDILVEAHYSNAAAEGDNTFYKQVNDEPAIEVTPVTNKAEILNITGDGYYEIQAWAEHPEYGSFKAEPLYLQVDRTRPAISPDVKFEKTDIPLEPSGFRSFAAGSDTQMRLTVEVTDNLSGVASVKAITNDGDIYELHATGNADEFSTLITKKYEGDIYLESTDIAGNTSRVLAGQVVIDDEQPVISTSVGTLTDVSAQLSGAASFTKDSLFTEATLLYKKQGDSAWQQAVAFESAEDARHFDVLLEGLEPATTYQVQVQVKNMAGTMIPGGHSEFVTFSSAPKAPEIVRLTSRSVSLEVLDNALYRLYDGEEWSSWATKTQYEDLVPEKEYLLQVKMPATDAVPESMPVNMAFTTYALQPVTFNPNCTDDSVQMPPAQQVNYSDTAQKPADLQRRVDHFFTGWYTEAACTQEYLFDEPVTEPVTLYAGWTPNTIGSTDYTVIQSPNATGWNNKAVQIVPQNGYTAVWDGTKWVSSYTVSEGTHNDINFRLRRIDSNGVLETVALDKPLAFKVDTTAPTGEIHIGKSAWRSFLHIITFTALFDDTYTATINGTDNLSGVDTIEYWRSDKQLSLEELLTGSEWKKGSSYHLKENESFVLYARITDKAGNYTIISSQGIVVASNEQPEPPSTSSSQPPTSGTSGGGGQDNTGSTTTGSGTRTPKTTTVVVYQSDSPLMTARYAYDGMWTNDAAAAIDVTMDDSSNTIAKIVYTIGEAETERDSNDSFTITDLPDGEYPVTIQAFGSGGKELESISFNIMKDTVTPELSVSGLPEDKMEGGFMLSVTATPENISGISLSVSVDDGAFEPMDSSMYSVTRNGIYTFRVITGAGTVVDQAVTVTQIIEADVDGGQENGSPDSEADPSQNAGGGSWALPVGIGAAVVLVTGVAGISVYRKRKRV